MPLISVLMLSYNHERFILNALNSVLDNVSNSYDIEIIIIDDGSTDNTAKIVNDFISTAKINVSFYEQGHEGVRAIAKNFNKLISLANGDYLTFLASDDYYMSNRFLKKQLDILENNKSISICYANGLNYQGSIEVGAVMNIDSVRVLSECKPSSALDYVTSNIPTIFIQSILVKASSLANFQAFDEELIADDWVFNIRIFEHLQNNRLTFSFINEPVFIRNIHDKNTSGNPQVHYLRVKEVADKYCKQDGRNTLVAKVLLSSCLQLLKNMQLKQSFHFLSKNISSAGGGKVLIGCAFNLLKKKSKRVW